MKPDQLLAQFEDTAIVTAIAAAEIHTTGEIRVFVSRESPSNVMEHARRLFKRLGMHHTQSRNGVLLYLAPRIQRFAIIGDEGIHQICGQGVWDEVASTLAAGFRQQLFTESVIAAIQQIGAHLAIHFPKTGEPRNELPNEVMRD